MTAEPALVTCDDASKTYGSGATAVVAVHGSTCRIAPGDSIAISGPSGSGKSTLLHLLAGLEIPTQGRVSWPALSDMRGIGLATAIGVVFQSPSLIPTLTVAENVSLPLALAGVPDADACSRVEEALEAVNAAGLADKLPAEISGGQAQRVAVARVLVTRPRLILADEPTGKLDRLSGQRLVDALLMAARVTGAALVVTTHDPTIAERLNTRWLMHDGRLITTAASAVGA